jgi:nitroreductase/dihydropteridine reductase
MTLLSNLNWRYATKSYDNTKTLPKDVLDNILEAVQMAPTSSGLQPFEVFVVSDTATRQKLRAAGFDQPQFTDSSVLLVFAAWDNYTTDRINKVFDHIHAVRGTPASATQAYRDRLIASYMPRPAHENFEHAARQAYIALGTALVAAAEAKVDSTPMEGFDPAAFDEILGLKAKGLRSAAVLALGYRDATSDWLVNQKKVRRPKSEMFSEVA